MGGYNLTANVERKIRDIRRKYNDLLEILIDAHLQAGDSSHLTTACFTQVSTYMNQLIEKERQWAEVKVREEILAKEKRRHWVQTS